MNPEQKPLASSEPAPMPPLAPVPAPSSQVTAAPPLPAPPAPIPSPNKSHTKILVAVGCTILIILLALGVSLLFKNTAKTPVTHEVTEDAISLPKDSTVTAECVNGRGKQYISPKDIPMGPIYDVYQGKVVAIEYLVGQKELSEQSSMFANLNLPRTDYDHLAIIPTAPHAGLDESHFHAIAYLISADAAKKITCGANSDSSMHMSEDTAH